MKAVFTLQSAESRRLIAKGVMAMPIVTRALREAYTILCGGTTNAYIAQEILNDRNIKPEACTAGISSQGVLCVTDPSSRQMFPNVFKNGKPSETTIQQAFQDFKEGTVVIKGANAVDMFGNAGIVTSGFDGGTVPLILGTVTSQGLPLIIPVGLEKLVPSVKAAAEAVGARRIDRSLGADFGMYCIATGKIITEIEALDLLFGVKAVHIASGGVGDNQGAVTLAVDGTEEAVNSCVDFILEKIKGEPAIKGNKGNCAACRYFRCEFCGRADIPGWMKK